MIGAPLTSRPKRLCFDLHMFRKACCDPVQQLLDEEKAVVSTTTQGW